MHIVTGASQNHFKSLCQFLNSLQTAQLANTHVWDFGISAESLAHLEVSFKNKGIRIHRFPFEEYPDYFAIEKEAGHYAWKPVAIYLTALEVREGVLLWCDAGNRRDGPLENARIVIRSQGVYSPISAGTMRTWTHPGCLAWFGIGEEDPVLRLPPRNGAIVGFDLGNVRAWQLLETWAELAQQKDCIAPAGSSRANHRQDQAVLSVLYYRFTKNKSLASTNICLITHQDCD